MSASVEEAPRNHHEDPSDADTQVDSLFASHRCCFPSTWWEPISSPSQESHEDPWWFRGWMKLREWSEIVCGPKWKTFIRRFSKNRPGNKAKFHYDPLSYSLNFDDGQDHHVDENNLKRNFSMRYASIRGSANTSVDFAKGPVFD